MPVTVFQLFGTATTTTWNWPTGVTSVIAEAIGGGGGGGIAQGNPSTGGGGKGGSYAKATITKGAESLLNLIIGAGGGIAAAGAASTVVQSGTTRVSAAGGGGGATQATSSANGAGGTTLNGSNTGTTTFAGGNGGTGNFTSGTQGSGAGGGAGGPTSVGGAGTVNAAGTAGTGNFANGVAYAGPGAAGVGNSSVGTTPVVYGGGASGGKANSGADQNGGTGQRGCIVLTWDAPDQAVTNVFIASTVTLNAPTVVLNVVQATIVSGSVLNVPTVAGTAGGITGGLRSMLAFWMGGGAAGTPAVVYARTITIDHTKAGGATHTDFPVMIAITDVTLKNLGYGGHVRNTSGHDIQFFSDSGLTTKLAWEIDSYDPTTGKLLAWVKIPSLSHLVDTVIYMGYGDASVSTFQGNTAGTWSNSYKAVYHFGNGSTLSLADALGVHGLTNNGAVAAGAGQFGGAAQGGSGKSFSTAAHTDFNLSAATILATIKPTGQTGGNAYALAHYTRASANPNTSAWAMYLQNDDRLASLLQETVQAQTTAIAQNVWFRVAIAWNGTTIRHTVNGTNYSQGQTAYPSSDNSYPLLLLANGSAGYHEFVGLIDDLFIVSGAKSDEWMVADYNTIMFPSTFYALGTESTAGGGVTGGTIASGSVLYVPTVAVAATSATLFKDNFTDTDGTNLTTHVPDVGSMWTAQQGAWKILSNSGTLQTDSGDSQNVATFEAGMADGSLAATIIANPGGASYFGLIFNFQDNNNYWLADANSGAGAWHIYERSGGTFTERVAYSAAVSSGTTYAVEVRTLGDHIKVFINGTLRLSYFVVSRPHKTATKHGIRIYGLLDGPIPGSRFDFIEFKKVVANLPVAKTFGVINWKGEEASGNRVDAINSFTLLPQKNGGGTSTVTGSVGSTTGKFGTAIAFGATGDILFWNDSVNPLLSANNRPYTWRGWVKLNSKAASSVWMSRWGSAGDKRQFYFGYESSLDKFYAHFTTYNANPDLISPTTGITVGQWYLIHVVFDPAVGIRGQLRIVVNAETLASSSVYYVDAFDIAPSDPTNVNSGVMLGAVALHDVTSCDIPPVALFDGAVDDVVFLQDYAMTAADIEADYNGGAGVAYADWAAGGGGAQSITGSTIASGSVLFAPMVGVWQLLSNAVATGTDSATTAGIDTSGADLLLAFVAYTPGSNPTVTDSKSCTWNRLNVTELTTLVGGAWFWARPSAANVGTGHTFTSAMTSGRLTISVQAWRHSKASPFDVETANSGLVVTQVATNMYPTEGHVLVVSATAFSGTALDPTQLNSSDLHYHRLHTVGAVGGVNANVAVSYMVQDAALDSEVNSVWVYGGTTRNAISVSACFKFLAAPADQVVVGGTIASGSGLTAPSITTGPVTVLGPTIPAPVAPQLNAPTVAPGPATVIAQTVSSVAQLFAVSLAVGAVSVVGGTRATTITLNAPTLQAQVLGATILSGLVLFASAVVQNVTLGTITPTGQVFSPAVASIAGQSVTTGSVVSTLQVFAPSLAVGAVTVVSGTRSSVLALNAPSVAGQVLGATIVGGSGLFAPSVAYVVTTGTRAATSVLSAPSVASTVVTGTRPTTAVLNAPTVAVGATTVVGGTRVAATALFSPTVLETGVIGGPTTGPVTQLFGPTVLRGPVTVSGGTVGTTLQLIAPAITTVTFVTTGTRVGGVAVNPPAITTGAISVSNGTFTNPTQVFAPAIETLTFVVGATIPPTRVLSAPRVFLDPITGFIFPTVVFFGPTVSPEVGDLIGGFVSSTTVLFPPSLKKEFPSGTCLTSGVAVHYAVTSATISVVVAALAEVQVRYAVVSEIQTCCLEKT